MAEKKNNKRVGSIIFRIVLIIIAGLTVGVGVFSWNAAGLVGNQLPMPFGFGISVVMSPSMEPVLYTNDLIFVTEQDSYELDDIVVYQDGNMLVIHRIVNIDGDTVITKGDANNVSDNPISMEDVKAKLSFKIPFIGLIVKYVKTVPGTLIVLALAIFLLYRSRRKERETDREELDDIAAEIKRLRESLANNAAQTEKSADTASNDFESGTDKDSEEDSDDHQAENESKLSEDSVDKSSKTEESVKEEQSNTEIQGEAIPSDSAEESPVDIEQE